MTIEPGIPRPNARRPERRLVLKFPDHALMPLDAGAATEVFRQTAAGRALVEVIPNVRLSLLFEGFAPEAMNELLARARTYDPTYVPPNFYSYYAANVTEAQGRIALDALSAYRESFDAVYLQNPAPLPPMPPLVNYTYSGIDQDHLEGTQDNSGTENDWQGGVNSFGVWAEPSPAAGSDGSGVLLVDLEMGWALPQTDIGDWDTAAPLDPNSVHLIWGTPRSTYRNADVTAHGARTLGVVRALDNGTGHLGVAPLARLAVVSQFAGPNASPDDADVPQTSLAILKATQYMQFGDVLLLEAQERYGMGGTPPNGPVEKLADVFDAIRLAVATGVVVIEAAGNGYQGGSHDPPSFDLDSEPSSPLNPGSTAFRDSGAILVARGMRPTGTNSRWRLNRSTNVTYGRRVNCFAQSSAVLTPAGEFDGSSAASAIIAGAAVAVQGMCQAALGRRIAPETMRQLLSNPDHGTNAYTTPPASPPPPPPPQVEPIGVMPDLAKIHAVIGGLADVYLRDTVGDQGVPHSSTPCFSPDLIVRHAASSHPGVEFGGPHWNTDFCQDVITGADHQVYVRVTNHSNTNDATGVSVTVYWAPPSALTAPSSWTRIGETFAAGIDHRVSAGAQVVLGPILWPSGALPTTPGHNCCLIGLVRSDNEPTTVLQETWQPTAGFTYTIADFARMVQLNNNVAWRNVEVIPPPPPNPTPGLTPMMNTRTGVDLPFEFPGMPAQETEMELVIQGSLPPEAELWLTGPAELLHALAGWRVVEQLFGDKLRAALSLADGTREGVLFQGRAKLAAKSTNQLGLFVRVAPKAHRKTFEVFASQRWRGVELGRLTWRFEAPKKKPAKKKPAKKKPKGPRTPKAT